MAAFSFFFWRISSRTEILARLLKEILLNQTVDYMNSDSARAKILAL